MQSTFFCKCVEFADGVAADGGDHRNARPEPSCVEACAGFYTTRTGLCLCAFLPLGCRGKLGKEAGAQALRIGNTLGLRPKHVADRRLDRR